MNISDVKSEYVINERYETVKPTEELLQDWPILTTEEREDWFTATAKESRFNAFNARRLMENLCEEYAEEINGYEEMEIHTYQSITDSQFDKLQKALDSITSNSAFIVYVPCERIDTDDEEEV